MLDTFIQQAERDYADSVAAELARQREAFKKQSDMAIGVLRDVLRANLNEDVYRVLNFTFDYQEESGNPVASFLDGDHEYRMELRKWDEETYPPLHITPRDLPTTSGMWGHRLLYRDGALTTNLLLYVKACRDQFAKRAAYQKQQAEIDARYDRQQAEKAAEQERNAAIFKERQSMAEAIKRQVEAEARAAMKTNEPLARPITVYKWMWAVLPMIDTDGDVIQGERDVGWSTIATFHFGDWIIYYSPDDDKIHEIRIAPSCLHTIERITFDSWADCPDELVEPVYAVMPDNWVRGYDKNYGYTYGWLQLPPNQERIDVGTQPVAWVRGLDYGDPGQRCACGEFGNVYRDGLWNCYNCWQQERADVSSDNLPF